LPDQPLKALDGWALGLLTEARVARLGLLDSDDRPRVLPVTYALSGERIWSAIDSKPKRRGREPARLGFLRRRPDVALTVDRYDENWSRLAWVQILGVASIHDTQEEPDALAALIEKYEPYRAEAPAGPLIAIRPSRALAWRAEEGRESG
jgi:PPOX class probable F420-dependent enzyme